MNKKTLRPAIAMIELIFAIVIIGIVLMSAPMLIQQAAKSGYVATQQEGIHEAASQINMIMGHYWDENNTESNVSDTIIKTSGITDLDESNRTLANGFVLEGYRVGTPKESLRNFKVAGNLRVYASNLGNDGGDTDDIDDFNGNVNLYEVEGSNADYIEKEADINIATSVVYISDTPATGTSYNSNTLSFDPDFTGAGSTTTSTNIKRITATLTSNSDVDELNKTIILHAFSCNIGGSGELGWK